MRFITQQLRSLLLSALMVVVSVCVSNVSAQGTFTDKRDGKTYKTVTIGGKTWLAENLNYQIGKSLCYDNDNANCDKYGKLYDWNTAKKACLPGWHLPTSKEWDNLAQVAGGKRERDYDMELGESYIYFWVGVGKKLRDKNGWEPECEDCGTDDFGFSALPGGNGTVFTSDVSFSSVGSSASWWAVSSDPKKQRNTRYIGASCPPESVCENFNDWEKSYNSIRCVQD